MCLPAALLLVQGVEEPWATKLGRLGISAEQGFQPQTVSQPSSW
jgi:hypothetical protein